jgi:hypothetical protein
VSTLIDDTGISQAPSGWPLLNQIHGALVAADLLARAHPKRTRQPSFTTILRQARKAGAARVDYHGAVVHLTGDTAPAEPESDGNEWDTVLPEVDHGSH